MAAAPYPWDRLPRLSRDEARAARRIRRAVAPSFALERVAAAIGEVLSADVRLAALHRAARQAVERERAVFLETADGALSFSVEPEPALATLVLSRVLGRRESVTAQDTPLDASTRGALAAVLVEMGRRAGSVIALLALPEPRGDAHDGADDGHAPDARIDVTVTVDGRPYRAAVTMTEHVAPTARPVLPASIEDLGELPIRIPLVAAASLAERAELSALVPGDVWLPGTGWLTPHEPLEGTELASPRHRLARAALCPADSERGIAVGHSDAGKLVLRGDFIALGADVAEITAGRGGDDEAMSGTEETLTSMALDAPIVVRVEVGSVTLTAREWAALKPGDVLETGLRLSEPAVLRVAGREVARGELVNVDGELGVRIRELVERERTG